MDSAKAGRRQQSAKRTKHLEDSIEGLWGRNEEEEEEEDDEKDGHASQAYIQKLKIRY